MAKQKIKVTQDVISSVRAYLLARAYAETMRQAVDKVYREILEEFPCYDTRTSKGRHTPTGRQILKSEDLYLCEDEASVEFFYMESNHRLRECGLKPDEMSDTHCPALVAESIQRDTERLVISSTADMIGQGDDDMHHMLLCAGMDKYHQFIDLSVKMTLAYCEENNIEMKIL